MENQFGARNLFLLIMRLSFNGSHLFQRALGHPKQNSMHFLESKLLRGLGWQSYFSQLLGRNVLLYSNEQHCNTKQSIHHTGNRS